MRVIIEKVMGKAFSCCCSRKEEFGESLDESTRLLTPSKINGRTDSNNYQTINRPNLGSLTDLFDVSEDNSLDETPDKIVEKDLSKRLIDITSIDRPIDKCEWEERLRLYQKRVAQIDKPLVLTSKASFDELPEESPPERHFNPISEEDLRLITYLSERASEAVLKGFQIKCEDSVVVAFNPWTQT